MKSFKQLREDNIVNIEPEGVITGTMRKKIASEFSSGPLSGHPYFSSFGQGLSAALNILAKYGIEPGDSVSPPLGDKGRVRVSLAFTNTKDSFSPKQIAKTDLILVWEKIRPYNYEIIAYLS